MATMNARLRAFLDEVREWFWAHDYTAEEANDLLIAEGYVLRSHPELTPIELLRDILEADPLEFLDLDTNDSDVKAILEIDALEGVLAELLAIVVRQILREEDRPEGWESLPRDQRDGPTAKEDKRRLELLRQALERELEFPAQSG